MKARGLLLLAALVCHCSEGPLQLTERFRAQLNDIADLSSLKLTEATFSPSFSVDVTSYSVFVRVPVTRVTVAAVAADAQATLRINNGAAFEGEASAEIILDYGPNSIHTQVISSDGKRTKTYTITVTRGFVQEAYIKAVNNGSSDQYGEAVAIHGDTMVVGAFNEASNQNTITNGATASSDDSNTFAGAAYVYQRTGSTWVQQAYLKAANNDGAGSLEYFGHSVAISGDTIAVGAYLEDSNQTTITNGTGASADDSNANSGAVYVYKRSGSTWVQEAYIKAANNTGTPVDDWFGLEIDLDGDTLVVGSYREDSNQNTITNGTTASADNSFTDSGAVYVYKRTGSTWAQEAYIKAANNSPGDNFGTSVAISGDTIAVGAFKEDSNQNTITNGTGASSNNSNTDSGAVYVYKRTGSSWAQEAYIKAANNNGATTGDWFGEKVGLYGDTLVVGAKNEDSNQTMITNGSTATTDDSNFNSGAVYVYKRTGTSWAQEAYIKAANNDGGTTNDSFGSSVAIWGDSIVVGVQREDSSLNAIINGTGVSTDDSVVDSGAMYLYVRSGTSWKQAAYFKAANNDVAAGSDFFGCEVDIWADTIVTGAYFEDSNQTTITNGTTASSDNTSNNSGAAYVYR